mmetsp:Transcript_39270/g.84547  ORF Transcript_39270/g.84547 Transcript_39270/m.84547 type:complete len:202 (-) Transcript_39270:573-1178(-)
MVGDGQGRERGQSNGEDDVVGARSRKFEDDHHRRQRKAEATREESDHTEDHTWRVRFANHIDGEVLPNGSAQKGPRNEHRLQGITGEAQGDAQSEGRQLSQGEDQEVPRVALEVLFQREFQGVDTNTPYSSQSCGMVYGRSDTGDQASNDAKEEPAGQRDPIHELMDIMKDPAEDEAHQSRDETYTDGDQHPHILPQKFMN